MTLPQLSPTHSQGRIIKIEVQNGSSVSAYDPVLIDTQEEGVIRDLKSFYVDQWIPIGTELGIIDDGEPVSGDWTWQAYIDDGDYEGDEEGTKKRFPESA